MISTLLASGNITNPFTRLGVTWLSTSDPNKPGAPLFTLLGTFFKLAIVIASLYALFNFLLAGYQYMSAGGDPKNISKASAKIYQTMIGLLVAAGSVTIAAVIGYLIFQDATFLIIPRIITPT